jgi:hypothetical protein
MFLILSSCASLSSPSTSGLPAITEGMSDSQLMSEMKAHEFYLESTTTIDGTMQTFWHNFVAAGPRDSYFIVEGFDPPGSTNLVVTKVVHTVAGN